MTHKESLKYLSFRKSSFIPHEYRPVLRGNNLRESGPENVVLKFKPSKKVIRCPIILAVEDDGSQTATILESSHIKNARVLYYDDLGKTWDYSFFKGRLCFHLGDVDIEPTGVYNRPYFPNTNDQSLKNLFTFLSQALEVMLPEMIGARSDNAYNGSKAYQMISTIKQAANQSMSKISTPVSYFIKGEASLLKRLIKRERNLIVKSCSGIRSIVVNQKEFCKWDCKNLRYIPTFFQKHLKGHDVRVHILNHQAWAVKVAEKNAVDYRYAKSRSKYQIYQLKENQKSFCFLLQKAESLHLVGIDLIVNKRRTYCLECNPGPGWAGFHRNSGDEPFLINTLMKGIG